MKDGKDEYISSKNTKIAQLIFKEMMSEMATDKSRFKMPSSVIQEGSELRIKGEKRDSSQIRAYRIQQKTKTRSTAKN